MKLEKYSIGVGDRFAHQAEAQLNALIKAQEAGIDIVPVWNKSYREHTTIGSRPQETKTAAENAVQELDWKQNYYIDADHINISNVDFFVDCSNFFTLDVADYIGKKADPADIQAFVEKFADLKGELILPGPDYAIHITEETLTSVAEKYLIALKEAAKLYKHIEEKKGIGNFITEVSMDETDEPQTPVELFLILAGLADMNVPVQTIAPKFSGRFNKGVNYVGNPEEFENEFEADVAVIKYSVEKFNLPTNLKLSIHSGSDKFSIYEPIKRTAKKYDAGLHVKTAGTTWLEEVIGLAEAGGEGLNAVKNIYEKALNKYDELCTPYATVLDINKEHLPSAKTAAEWNSEQFAAAVRHEPDSPDFNPDFRQLMHVAYKLAAQMGDSYTALLKEHSDIIAANVEYNILERHIKRIFPH